MRRNGHETRTGEVAHAEHLPHERRPAAALPIGAEPRYADRFRGRASGLGSGRVNGGGGGERRREEEREGEGGGRVREC